MALNWRGFNLVHPRRLFWQFRRGLRFLPRRAKRIFCPGRIGALLAGGLLFEASEFINDVLSHGQTLGGPAGMDLLAYAVVMGPRSSALAL